MLAAMKRVVLVLLLVVVGWSSAVAVYYAMASDETKVRRLFEDEVAAFNGRALLGTMAGFAGDYRDETRGIGRQQLRGWVIWSFQNRRAADGGYRYRIELPDDRLEIVVEEDEARADLSLSLYDRVASEQQPSWGLLVHAELERRDGGWCIVRSTHETVAGKAPR